MPGPVLHLSQVGRAFGLTSGTSSARASYAATQAAAAAAGPGAILQYEAYVMNGNADGGGSVWKKVPLNHMLGSAHLKSRASLWHKVVGARGLFQTRLQARMAAAGQAGDQGEATTEPWLVMLADKLVQVRLSRYACLLCAVLCAWLADLHNKLAVCGCDSTAE